MQRALPFVLALSVLVCTGLVHGRWTGRWIGSEARKVATSRLQRVPRTLGSWQGKDLSMDPKIQKQAQIDGYIQRRYENTATGIAVQMLLVCGRPGPIAAHSPEVCYPGAGFEAIGSVSRQVIEPADVRAPKAEFLTAAFGKPGPAEAPRLEILWSLNSGTGWEAVNHPRLRFGAGGYLFKLYIVQELSRDAGAGGALPAREFARDLLPALERALRE